MLTREEAKKIDEARSAAADARWRGDWDQAIAIHKQLIADLERLLGPDHPDTRAWQGNLYALYKDQARAIREQVAELDAAKYAMVDARGRGDWDQAIAGYKQYIADLERILGPDHRDIGAYKVGLQDVYSDQALAIQKQLVADRERVLGPDHPDTLIARVRLQEMFYAKRLASLSLEAQEQLAADCARVLGPDHPVTFSISALMQSYDWSRGHGKGLSMEAEEQLAADSERILGPDHPTTCTLQHSLAARRAESAPLLYDDPSWR